ncbi:MAG: isoamylase early set domain-containing protein [Gemmatimonadales bacterium]
MPADHSHELQDETLRRAVAELRRPVALDPETDAAALRRIRSHPDRPLGRPWWRGVRAAAALAACVLLALFLRAPASERLMSGARPVELRLLVPTGSRVVVVGDFNDWDPAATPLRPAGEPGVWKVELRLKPGRYHYTFLVDQRHWVRDPSEPPVPQTDFGTPMSVLTVS